MTDAERREQIRKRVRKATLLSEVVWATDADLIAHAPADLAWLDKRLTEAEREVGRLRAALVEIANASSVAVRMQYNLRGAESALASINGVAHRTLIQQGATE